MDTITITTPDDWHLHLRDGAQLDSVAVHSARQFGRALVMPNLKPPVATVDQALAYRRRILDALPEGSAFQPLMSLYLTDATTPDEVRRAAETPEVLGFKLYPAGATTNSEAGVSGLEAVYPVLEAMEKHGVALQVHGEVTEAEVDIFDRERAFIDRHLRPITQRFPALRIVLEHITTRDGVEFVEASNDNVAGTLTAHHLLYNRNAMLVGGIRPHYYCLPVLKREEHRKALLQAATGGSPKFFLGTDSAPHAKAAKETACGCAGCYTAYAALELYAEAFESAGRLNRLEAFASHHGPDFYRLPRNSGTVTLRKEAWTAPDSFAYGDDVLVPLRAGGEVAWRLTDA
ncbi:dihydroorotase [Methylogaea oryzae]|uniref:Dihydroorotase n=1 Tax=Methylogaea oryzae TaxID=1295382 RepID=A0A8D4VQF2_9GAMM|nr:dihydroorotase [Methylogaea oryzae]BBL71454.1 dihydroorotase [Methylogaea oryzae]